jgi:hypothetical protein
VSKRWVLITIRQGFVIIYLNQSSERNMIDISGCSERTNFKSIREKYDQNVVSRLRKLINMKIRIAKYRSHLYFNHQCKENKLLPFSLPFKPPIRSRKGYKLISTGFSFLTSQILRVSSRCSLTISVRVQQPHTAQKLTILIQNYYKVLQNLLCLQKLYYV